MRARTITLLTFATLFTFGGCKQVLSIEDAELDPTLATGGTAGNGGTAGSAGTGGSQGDGQAGSGGDSGIDLDAGTPCEQYCNTLKVNCTGEYAVYADTDVCLATCKAFPEGLPDAEQGNSLYCRLHAAQTAARLEPDFYCPAAGPGGNKKCGTNCEGLCSIIKLVCVGDNPHYADETACLTDCAKLPDPQPLDAPNYSIAGPSNKYNGPTVQCRLLHACNSALEPDDHCSHAMGLLTCVNRDGGS
jgi:hypothetical protein